MAGSFLTEPAVTPRVQQMFDEDIAGDGFVWNNSRLNAHQPETMAALFALATQAFEPSGFSLRQRGILVLATAAARGDSYCSLAWGGNLADAPDADADLAAAVLSGTNAGLTAREVAMASWARQVVTDPNATTEADVQSLRDAGLSDSQIFAITVFVSLRLAMATINDALGAGPDEQLVASLPPQVVSAVTWGRPPH